MYQEIAVNSDSHLSAYYSRGKKKKKKKYQCIKEGKGKRTGVHHGRTNEL